MSNEIIRSTREEMAQKIAKSIPANSFVNLGIGQPTMVANYIPDNYGVILHTENGMLGMGPVPAPGEEDSDLTNAGRQPVTIKPGGSYFHHVDAFAMMRGGHLDYCVLGAYQVSVTGDIANWHTGAPDAIPSVGGAMELAIGAKHIFVMMTLFTKKKECKIVEKCTYPLTGIGCVRRIYTDYAVFEITDSGLMVLDMVSGLTLEKLTEMVGLPLRTVSAV